MKALVNTYRNQIVAITLLILGIIMGKITHDITIFVFGLILTYSTFKRKN